MSDAEAQHIQGFYGVSFGVIYEVHKKCKSNYSIHGRPMFSPLRYPVSKCLFQAKSTRRKGRNSARVKSCQFLTKNADFHNFQNFGSESDVFYKIIVQKIENQNDIFENYVVLLLLSHSLKVVKIITLNLC